MIIKISITIFVNGNLLYSKGKKERTWASSKSQRHKVLLQIINQDWK